MGCDVNLLSERRRLSILGKAEIFKSSSLKPVQNAVRDLDVESRGVQVISKPLLHRLMLGIAWINEDLDQLVVAANAAAIFRGAGIRAGETNRVLEFRIGR